MKITTKLKTGDVPPLKELMANLKDKIDIFEILKPVVSPPKDEKLLIKWAEETLNCDRENKKQVKLRYKELAKTKHPDRVSALGLDKKFVDIANQNFLYIKQAYDILNEL